MYDKKLLYKTKYYQIIHSIGFIYNGLRVFKLLLNSLNFIELLNM
jgi:hypothetical protein